ncbi:Flavin-containing monooxygenase [Ceraceosorus bombacis]|uniref:L-ornithine N(5)-monooxygenase [NAD(P)H] n=1 Tax=Ceraceosorus bombacis TaxID=401625 RepID=A0A0N7LB40_9BASI|nr:Flavin-containing monooxygenase [Ceraceosorus bombacis]
MRDPTSSYSFVSYLHSMGRLAAFINREATIPSRREWSAYLTWAAKRMDEYVSYAEDVESIEPVTDTNLAVSEGVKLLRVTTKRRSDGHVRIRLARNITVGVGGIGRVPAPLANVYPAQPWTAKSRVIHTSTFLPSLAAIAPLLRTQSKSRSLRIAVIGSGQSAAESALHLHRTYPEADVNIIFRASAIVPSDDSALVNSAAFDPHRTDTFWRAGSEERAEWLREYKRTNYSVVRSDVLNAIDEIVYDQQIEFDAPWPGADGPSKGRLNLLPNTQVDISRLVGEGDDQQIELTTSDTKPNAESESKTERFDLVVLGTGFERAPACMKFLQPLAPHFPALDPEADKRRAELGYPQEVETLEARRAANEAAGERAEERLRERVRGIARDYHLVPYASQAFSPNHRSGTSSPTSSSSSRTLSVDATSREGIAGAFQPGVFVLGGNEATHGLSDSLLSIVAHRAGELTRTILARTGSVRREASPEPKISTAVPTSPMTADAIPKASGESLIKPLINKVESVLHA